MATNRILGFGVDEEPSNSNSNVRHIPATPMNSASSSNAADAMSPIEREIRAKWQESTNGTSSSVKQKKGGFEREEDDEDSRSIMTTFGTKLNEEELHEFKTDQMKYLIRTLRANNTSDLVDRAVSNSNDQQNIKSIVTGIKDQSFIDQQMLLKMIEDFLVFYPDIKIVLKYGLVHELNKRATHVITQEEAGREDRELLTAKEIVKMKLAKPEDINDSQKERKLRSMKADAKLIAMEHIEAALRTEIETMPVITFFKILQERKHEAIRYEEEAILQWQSWCEHADYIYDKEYQEYLENKIEVAEAQLVIDLIQEERTIRARLGMQLEIIRSRVSMLMNEIIEILNKIPKLKLTLNASFIHPETGEVYSTSVDRKDIAGIYIGCVAKKNTSSLTTVVNTIIDILDRRDEDTNGKLHTGCALIRSQWNKLERFGLMDHFNLDMMLVTISIMHHKKDSKARNELIEMLTNLEKSRIRDGNDQGTKASVVRKYHFDTVNKNPYFEAMFHYSEELDSSRASNQDFGNNTSANPKKWEIMKAKRLARVAEAAVAEQTEVNVAEVNTTGKRERQYDNQNNNFDKKKKIDLTNEEMEERKNSHWYPKLTENLSDKFDIEDDVKYTRPTYILNHQGIKVKYHAEDAPCPKCAERHFCEIRHGVKQCGKCKKYGHLAPFCHQRKPKNTKK
jgi:hypothetical protein